MCEKIGHAYAAAAEVIRDHPDQAHRASCRSASRRSTPRRSRRPSRCCARSRRCRRRRRLSGIRNNETFNVDGGAAEARRGSSNPSTASSPTSTCARAGIGQGDDDGDQARRPHRAHHRRQQGAGPGDGDQVRAIGRGCGDPRARCRSARGRPSGASLRAPRPRCGRFPATSRTAAALAATWRAVIDEFGKVDILVNNAGTSQTGKFEEITDARLAGRSRAQALRGDPAGAAGPARA